MTRADPRRLLLLVGLLAASLAGAGCSSLIGVPEVPDVPDAADDGSGDAGGLPDSSSAPVDAGGQQ
jgi:hypothetical protein